jgi:hypothetical protein
MKIDSGFRARDLQGVAEEHPDSPPAQPPGKTKSHERVLLLEESAFVAS